MIHCQLPAVLLMEVLENFSKSNSNQLQLKDQVRNNNSLNNPKSQSLAIKPRQQMQLLQKQHQLKLLQLNQWLLVVYD